MSEAIQDAAAAARYPSAAYRWYVVIVLLVAYIFSYIDRTILTLLVAPIRASLHISDLQISLLHGFSFAVFFVTLGIPIARLADRYNRATIMSVGIFAWCFLTAACGLTTTFAQMFAARVGVGIGESAMGPAANSMLADMFPPETVARPLSLYYSAIFLGTGLALVAGGAIIAVMPPLDLPVLGHLEPWQALFMVVGLPGLVVVAFTATIREPTRTGVLRQANASGNVMRLGDVLRYMRARFSTYGTFILGFTMCSMVWNGSAAWIPTFFIRTFGWTAPMTGLRYGSAMMVSGLAGCACGGWLSSWLKRRGHTDGDVRVGIICALVMWPMGTLAPLMPTPGLALIGYCLFVFCAGLPWGAATAALQLISPNQMRALVIAILYVGLNLAGIGLGPTVVAVLTDRVFHDDMAVKYSLSLLSAVVLPISALILWRAAPLFRKTLAETNLDAEPVA